MIYGLIVFLPLGAAIIAGFFGKWISDRGAQLVTCFAVSASAVLSLIVFVDIGLGGDTAHVELLRWIDSGSFGVSWALQIDTLTAVMLVVVAGVSALVHWYSIGYMSHDPHIPRFMAYLSLFTFAMLMLVTADNLVQLFFGWEGVGLCSYLLIGFWYKKPAANAAAIKAFIVNRIGDFGFAIGIFGIFFVFGSVDYETIFAAAPEIAGKSFEFLGLELDIITTLTFLLFVGAMGKSAQIGLHTWLPDAMEGPTPVSALIHAATMVTAGVFMVVRMSPLFEFAPITLGIITVVGATTAIFAATVGMVQNDIKRVIAYSTCSQLGYMFFAIGVSAYGAAMFHLFTHAFFKALLFLGAGSIIHAMSDEQDMRKMGGLYTMLPLTYVLMWIGSLSLAGMPVFAGFFSKDIILEVAYAAQSNVGEYAFYLGLFVAFLTAFYSWRVIFMTFHGKSRGDIKIMANVLEAPRSMAIPMIILALGAIFAGLVATGWFVGDGAEDFWRESIFVLAENDPLEAAHHLGWTVKASPTVIGLLGILLAWYLYVRRTSAPAIIAASHSWLYQFLLNKWYFDEAYEFLFVRPAKYLGRLFWQTGDGKIIDGFGPDGIASTVINFARRASFVQTGFVYHYAFAMLIGVAGLVSWFLIWGGA
jgi:NADH-quinone oxidoreductase subunit L